MGNFSYSLKFPTLTNNVKVLFITSLRTRGRRPKGIENRRAKRKSKPIREPTVDVRSGSQLGFEDGIYRNLGTTVKWSLDDYKCFIEYYKAVDLSKFKNIEKRYRHLTPQNAFFLILYEMGMSDKDVCRIMGITQEAIRSTRFRIRKNNNM